MLLNVQGREAYAYSGGNTGNITHTNRRGQRGHQCIKGRDFPFTTTLSAFNKLPKRIGNMANSHTLEAQG